MDTVKACSFCKIEKPLTHDFWLPNKKMSLGFNSECRDCTAARSKKAYYIRKNKVLRHYSKGTPSCSCCGITEEIVLTIDHIHNDGAKHRRETTAKHMYSWIIKNNFPEGFRVLCYNCNIYFWKTGYCFHNPPT